MRDKRTTSRQSTTQSEGETKALRIKHIFPEGQRSIFSNHVTVQHTNEGEFTISFFEVVQPLLLGEPDDVAKQFAELDVAPANCLARVVVSAARMQRLIGALITNYEIYERDTGKSSEKDTDKQGGQKHAS